MKRPMYAALVSSFLAIGAAQAMAADSCDGLAAKIPKAQKAKDPGEEKSALRDFYTKFLVLISKKDPIPGEVDCASVVVAVQNLVNNSRTGGRSLEPNAPLDRAAAQAEVDAALQEPEVKQAIEAVHQAYPDEDVRLLMEAAVFDEHGSYAARDLRLAQLREKLGG